MSSDTLYMKFLSHFKTGVMRPNKYEIKFNLPTGVATLKRDGNPDPRVLSGAMAAQQMLYNGDGGINIKCHTTNFPQRNLVTSERLQNSSAFRVPYTQAYDPVTFSFYADATADTRRYFDLWQNSVINVRSNTLNYYYEFTANVEMWNLDEAGNRTYGVRLEEAYPIAVGAMDVAFGNSGTFQTITTTLQYRRWSQIGTHADILGRANNGPG